MMAAVKTYRWQCIECKCCNICGTSENDVRVPAPLPLPLPLRAAPVLPPKGEPDPPQRPREPLPAGVSGAPAWRQTLFRHSGR